MILPKQRDPRLITVRRGGTLQDADHRLLAAWAADCAQHVLHFFEAARPHDDRPRRAIELARAWTRSEVTMTEARTGAGHANAAARDLAGAARYAAYAAAQAAAVAHVAAHDLGAAAYAIKAVRAAAPQGHAELAGRLECAWQRAQLPDDIRDFVLDDQKLRNDILLVRIRHLIRPGPAATSSNLQLPTSNLVLASHFSPPASPFARNRTLSYIADRCPESRPDLLKS